MKDLCLEMDAHASPFAMIGETLCTAGVNVNCSDSEQVLMRHQNITGIRAGT